MPVRELDLSGRQPDELRRIAADIDEQLLRLHQSDDGSLRDLSGEEATEFDRLRRQQDAIQARLRQHEVIAETYARNPGAVQRPYGNLAPSGGTRLPEVMFRGNPWDGGTAYGGRNPRAELRGRALAANDATSRMPDAARQYAAEQIEADSDPESRLARFAIAASDPDYFRAFRRWFNDPTTGPMEWTPAERAAAHRLREECRTMSIGTTTAGGFLVPYELDPQILIAGTGSVNPMRQVSRVALTSYNEKRFVTSLGVTAEWIGENLEVADASPALLQPAIPCRKADAFVPVSFELFEDSDIQRQVETLLLDAKAQLEATAFTTGSGVAPNPKGIITALVAAGGSVVIATASNVLATADLYTNQAALPARWRPSAKFMASLPILNGYRQLPQATGLNYSIINDATRPPTCLGWQFVENSGMDPSLTGAAADYSLLSGSFEQFAIVDRVGTMMEFVPVLVGANQRPTGSRGFLMHWRTGSDVLIPDAFRLSNFST